MTLVFSEDYKLLEVISGVAIIAYTDSSGNITFANDNFCKISGYTKEELHNQNHRILNSNFHGKDFFIDMYKTIRAGKNWRGEIRNKRKDGTYYWVDTQIIPVFNKENKLDSIVTVRFDITDRKKMEECLINMEKLASLGELAAVVAHEINNPLAIIDLSTDLINKSLNRGNFNQDYLKNKLEIIINSSKRISKIVRGLKTFSRASESDEFVIMELKVFVEEVLSFCKAKCTDNEIEFKLKEIPNIEFECHPTEISQVLINLLNNAHDAASCLKEKWVELSFEVDYFLNCLTFKVRDSGTGIPEEISDKILTPFFTTKEIGKGTGLGLSISKAIAEEHGGEIYLDKTDKNTLFVFKIPLRHISKVKAA